jgi:L-amino acid N-acyltransferase YncA
MDACAVRQPLCRKIKIIGSVPEGTQTNEAEMITLRDAAENDLPGILAIYNDVILHTTAVYEYEPHTLEMRQRWFKTKQDQGFPVFVAIENEKIIGLSSIGPFRAWAAYKFSVENSVYVASNYRGKGIGKLLIAPLIEAAKGLQLHTIIAGIDASNEASLKLHEYFGFKEVAHFKEVGYKFNRWLDLKFLQLIL